MVAEEFRVAVWDKFELEARSDSDMMHLLQMRASGDISQKRLLIEAKRRGKFGEDFDVEEELEESNESEMPGAPTPEQLAQLAQVRAARTPQAEIEVEAEAEGETVAQETREEAAEEAS